MSSTRYARRRRAAFRRAPALETAVRSCRYHYRGCVNMRDFFRGRKRKIGAATLVVACVFTAAWIRSLTHYDELQVYAGTHTFHFLQSPQNGFALIWMQDVQNGRPYLSRVIRRVHSIPYFWVIVTDSWFNWRSMSIAIRQQPDAYCDLQKSFPEAQWTGNPNIFRCGVDRIGTEKSIIISSWHCFTVVCLTPFSACLLFSKQPKAKQTPPAARLELSSLSGPENHPSVSCRGGPSPKTLETSGIREDS